MSFLEVTKALDTVKALPEVRLRLIGSGMLDTLALFARGRLAEHGLNVAVDTLPFGTLRQFLSTEPDDVETIGLILPWDICAPLDWRSGVPTAEIDTQDLLETAKDVIDTIARRCCGCFAYLDAPTPSILRNVDQQQALVAELRLIAARAGASIVDGPGFSISSYLSMGIPVSGNRLSDVADTLAGLVRGVSQRGAGKVLITDLDNTLWRGVVGEDGPDGVSAGPEGVAYKHFIYQSFLRRLKQDGIVLAVVSRNDPDLARAPLETGEMLLNVDDFVIIEAGYEPKSEAIQRIAARLNLGIEAFVFVDDNPIELTEVRTSMPAITAIQFPGDDSGIAEFLRTLNLLFHRDVVTKDDRRRHDYYRNRDAAAAVAAKSQTVGEFLAGLDMRMTIYRRGPHNWDRAIQLINKTNQFNLNGKRWDLAMVGAVLDDDGGLYTASLSDNTGDHGEIITLLVDGAGVAQAFVMSCRVFQRRVEYGFLHALRGRLPNRLALRYDETERNTPFAMFLKEIGQADEPGIIQVDMAEFADAHAVDAALFRVVMKND
jgi:FkbH-like protein